jgi:predicted metal-binding protein
MKPLNELKFFFQTSPLAFMRTIPFNKIFFDDRCKFLCKYGCKNYQRKYCCPPDSLELKEEIQNHNYKWALLAATSCSLPLQITHYKKLYLNRQKEHEIQRISSTLHDLFIKNRIEHIILSGGACKKCQICSKILHLKCKKPNQKLTSMEAVGIDCQKTLSSAGFAFEMPGKNSINRCTALLFDTDEFSTVNWKKIASYQTFQKVKKNHIQIACDALQKNNPKMFEEIRLIPTSEIDMDNNLCDNCNVKQKNYSCPPYSDKVNLSMWDTCVLWKWNNNNSKKNSYNNALKLVHNTIFALGLYFAFTIRDCYCDECSICEYGMNDSPTCKSKKIMSPSMQSQGIDPKQFGDGKFGLELV